jgi:hypothetical protein
MPLDDKSDILRRVLQLRNKFGARTAVLVLGDGLNRQALSQDSYRGKLSWNSILRRIANRSGVSPNQFAELPQSTPLLWDLLVTTRASSRRGDLDSAEAELCKELAVELDRLERLRSHYDVYRKIRSIWFENILSFNVDRRLALSEDVDTFVPREGLSGDPVFVRHDVILRRGCGTRIWYPYGDTQNPETFRLGRGSHAEMIRDLEDRRTFLMLDWSQREPKLRPPDIVYQERLETLSTWYDLFFLAPLIFVGVKLSLEAWPLWWLLHQRARNFVPFEEDQIPATLYLKHKTEACPELMGGPCEIQTIEFNSYDELWDTFFKACECSGR